MRLQRCQYCNTYVEDMADHWAARAGACRVVSNCLPTRAEAKAQAAQARHNSNPSHANDPCSRCGRGQRVKGISHCRACRNEAKQKHERLKAIL